MGSRHRLEPGRFRRHAVGKVSLRRDGQRRDRLSPRHHREHGQSSAPRRLHRRRGARRGSTVRAVSRRSDEPRRSHRGCARAGELDDRSQRRTPRESELDLRPASADHRRRRRGRLRLLHHERDAHHERRADRGHGPLVRHPAMRKLLDRGPSRSLHGAEQSLHRHGRHAVHHGRLGHGCERGLRRESGERERPSRKRSGVVSVRCARLALRSLLRKLHGRSTVLGDHEHSFELGVHGAGHGSLQRIVRCVDPPNGTEPTGSPRRPRAHDLAEPARDDAHRHRRSDGDDRGRGLGRLVRTERGRLEYRDLRARRQHEFRHEPRSLAVFC